MRSINYAATLAVLLLGLIAGSPTVSGQGSLLCTCQTVKPLFQFTINRGWSPGLFHNGGNQIYVVPESGINTPHWYTRCPESYQHGAGYGGTIFFPNKRTYLGYSVPFNVALALADAGCTVTVTLKLSDSNGNVVASASTPPGSSIGTGTGLTGDAARLMLQRGATIHNRGTSFPSSGSLCGTVSVGGTSCGTDCVTIKFNG